MKNNIHMTKSRILIHLETISVNFTRLAIELKDLPPDSALYTYLINSKLLASRKFVDRLYNEARQIDIREPAEQQ